MTINGPCCGRPGEGVPPFFVDEDSCSVLVNGQAIGLTPFYTKFATVLASKYPYTATRTFIIDSLYGDDPNGGPDGADNLVSIYASYVRRKLQGTSLRIETVWGVGYKFVFEGESNDQ